MTRSSTHTHTPPRPGPARSGGGRRPAVTPDLVAELAARLTGRDRWLLAMLAEHRVLTTPLLAELGFDGRRQAERRLAQLWGWRCVDRFRPHTRLGQGSAPYHWVLDEAGAAVLAAAYGIAERELGYRRTAALAVAHSQRLGHTIGTNSLMTTLTTAHWHRGGRLAVWWGERRCTAAWGDLARPDAAGIWHTPVGDRLGFAVEYDTGTEALARVAAKLADYTDLAVAAGQVLPVLFWLPSAAREAALLRLFDPTALTPTPAAGATSPAGGLLVATAAADHAAAAGGPAGRVWRPATAAGLRPARRPVARVNLDQLAAAWPAGMLPVAALDVGLGWPAPTPRPDDDGSGQADAGRDDPGGPAWDG
jgi:hypothetical protein